MKSPEYPADPLFELRSFRESAVNFASKRFEYARSNKDIIEAQRWKYALVKAESGYWRDLQVNIADAANETLAQVAKEKPGFERDRLLRVHEFCLTIAREIQPKIIDFQQIRLSKTKRHPSSGE